MSTPSSSGPPAKKMKFAERMMAQMGWQAGTGLGSDGRGRLAPIETQLRPQGAGLGAVKEKTQQAREEEKRAAILRGEEPEESSGEERRSRRRRKAGTKEGAGAGKDDGFGGGKGGKGGVSTPGSARRRKMKYVTAEQVKSELAGLKVPENVLLSAFDLAGRSVGLDSPAAAGGFVAASREEKEEGEKGKAGKRIQLELVACAETRHALNERRAWLDDTTGHLVEELDRDKEELGRVRELAGVVEGLQELRIADGASWGSVMEKLKRLESGYSEADVERYGICDIAVAAVHPLFKHEMAEWEPPEINTELIDTLSELAPVLGHVPSVQDSGSLLAHRSVLHHGPGRSKKHSTPYETLLHSLFLPRLRNYINTTWDPYSPSTLPDLLKAWRPLLPDFIHAHIIHSLLIPRLENALTSWRPSRTSSSRAVLPHTFIFPYLPLLEPSQLDPQASNSLLSLARRRLRSALTSHAIPSGPPSWLPPWQPLLGQAVYSSLLTNHLLPRLTKHLNSSFELNPSDQEPTLPAFQQVLSYAAILAPASMAAVLKEGWIGRFKAVLREWLGTEGVQYEHVLGWYEWWRSLVPASMREHEVLWEDWRYVFDTIIRGVKMGPAKWSKEIEQEDKQSNKHTVSGASTPSRGPAQDPSTKAAQPAAPSTPLPPPPEVTFRDVLGEFAADNDLLLVALREAHQGTGSALLRLTASADQKGGVVGYVKGDVLWVRDRKDREQFGPVMLGDELVERAGQR